MAGKGKESASSQQPTLSAFTSKTSKIKLQQTDTAHLTSSLPGTHLTSSGASHSLTHGNTSGPPLNSTDQKTMYLSGVPPISGTHGNLAGSSLCAKVGKTANALASMLPNTIAMARSYGISGPNFQSYQDPQDSNTAKGLKLQLEKEKSVASLRGELGRERDEVVRLKGLLLKKEAGCKADHITELKTLKDANHRLSGQLTEERDAVRAFKTELRTQKDAADRLKTQLTLEQLQLEKERAAIKSMRGELQTKGAEVLRLKGLLLIKETEVGWALKAEHKKELKKLKDAVDRLSGQLKEERDAVQALRTELKTEKDAVHRLKTELALEHQRAPVSLQKKDQELISMRKQLGEAESNLKSSVESWKELQRSYDELNRKKEELIRSKTMADVYEYYRRWSEDQSSRSLGMKKYDSWQLEMAVNRASKESTGKTRCGAVYNSELDHKEVAIEILNNKSYQRQQDFNQKVDILTNIRHPNLVSYIGEYEKKYALICEHLPDGTLQDRLVNKRQTSWEERIRISATICSTLLFLHNMKPSPVIHGDLEAQNISFDADNVCKLSVFGMSYSTQRTTTTTTTNNNNNIVPSIQSDISAFGIVLLQIVTGQAEKDLVRKEVLKMGDLNQFQEKDIGWQREVLKNKKIVDDKLDNWPTEDAVKMLVLGLRCSHPEENERPDLATEVWTQISSMKRGASESQGRPGGLFGR
ncbi:hypothetical protein QYE76_039296 [Lolium multiflorum]|uniref:RING-type E3 ubiquitin transferase n=1 Tax=Lolium multiflorum TaxID=4521 RepID=A0AAD8TAL5_LOLMU|nr:hypothetical protein QYE76_039296 [Lolium multiflorum]